MKVKFHFPEIVFGILLAVAIFALGMTFESSRKPPANEQAQRAPNESSSPIAAEHGPDKITDWLLVALNFFLVGSTLLLWISTRKAANAAKAAAEHVPKVERAYLVGGGGLNSEGYFSLNVANYGKTPAFMNGFTVHFCSKGDLRKPPKYAVEGFEKKTECLSTMSLHKDKEKLFGQARPAPNLVPISTDGSGITTPGTPKNTGSVLFLPSMTATLIRMSIGTIVFPNTLSGLSNMAAPKIAPTARRTFWASDRLSGQDGVLGQSPLWERASPNAQRTRTDEGSSSRQS